MIISDSKRIAFVHIPKCAGKSLNRVLAPYDDTDGEYVNHRGRHPDLGFIDYDHLPLFVLRRYFKSAFRRVIEYYSFTVIRNPYSRFPSSFAQHMAVYGPAPLRKLSVKEIRRAIRETIAFLQSAPRKNYLLPAEYIHFQKQLDFTCLDGERALDRIVTIDEIEPFIDELESMIRQGDDGDTQARVIKLNQSLAYRNEFTRLAIRSLGPLGRAVYGALSPGVRARVRSALYVDRDSRFGHLFEEKQVRNFIRDYYADDIRLFERVRGGNSPIQESRQD